MGTQTEIIISARCGAAARGGVNEDNCLIMTSVGNSAVPIDHLGNGEYLSEVVQLGRNGCLLVVADGMGGMNAGEVASQMAVETISEVFRMEKMSKIDLTDENIRECIRLAILEADKAIREAGERNPEQQGMGTTVALLWILQDKVYYGWCGDSRIYRYLDGSLLQLSSDHSYVCEVLHLSEEEAFDHPENNIITRSLGNPNEEAVPEVAGPEPLRPGELFLLCSDGLCGVLRNANLLDDLQVAASNPEKLNEGNLLLWEDAENHQWHDNVTSLLCYVKSCPKPIAEQKAAISKTLDPAKKDNAMGMVRPAASNHHKTKFWISMLVAVLVILGVVFAVNHKRSSSSAQEKGIKQEQVVQEPAVKQQDKPANKPQSPASVQEPKSNPVEAQETQRRSEKMDLQGTAPVKPEVKAPQNKTSVEMPVINKGAVAPQGTGGTPPADALKSISDAAKEHQNK